MDSTTKNDGQGRQNYSTLDAYQAAFLSLNGHAPTLVTEHSRKVAFHFEATEALYQCIADYNNGATVEAIRLALAVKHLKSQIFSRRSNDESVNSFTRTR